jgi:hypothetical protein
MKKKMAPSFLKVEEDVVSQIQGTQKASYKIN